MFVPLHVKSDCSLGYGTASVEEIVGGAAPLGYTALALTDLENLYGQVRFHCECALRGIRPVTGVELRPGFDPRRDAGTKGGRVVLLAADGSGYSSLCRIVGRRRGGVRERGGGHPPHDPLPLVCRHSEGLFALSDDPSVVERLTASGRFSRQRLGVLLLRPDNPAIDRARREAAARLGIRLVADLDCIFLKSEDHPLHLLQTAIRQGRTVGEVANGRDAEGKERRLRSPEEVAALFADVPEAVEAAAEIAGECLFDLGREALRPAQDLPDSKAAPERLRRLCHEGIASRFPGGRGWTEGYGRRLEEELAVFEKLGFSPLMVVVAEIVAHCRREGIFTAARGSAVSSLALHLLGASPVDPLSQGLLFERFLHPGKSSWPDIDLDLPWHRRDEVIEWVYERFGRDRVAMVAAHHTFGYRSALREGLKAWGGSAVTIERLSRALPPDDLPVEDVDFLGIAGEENVDEILGVEVRRILPLVRRLVGRPHHIAVHPGGIIVGSRPLEDLLPLERAPKGVVITQYDLVAVDRLGLVKIDLLGNRALSELEETLTLARYPRPVRLASIPAEDPQTLALIDRGETLGCFQLESPAMRSLLCRLPVRRQGDLVAALALIRPGAAAGEVKSTFIRRARGEEAPDVAFPEMAGRLAETQHLLLYEEDIMTLLSRTGGVTLEEADEFRKGILQSGGDPAPLAELEGRFLTRARGRGTEVRAARKAWRTAARFAAYSFNKAHAASYALLAYSSAYTKVHHPLEFACALLNHHQGIYPVRTLAGEFGRMGIELRAPHVNASQYRSFCEGGKSGGKIGVVRVGLDKVKGMSARSAAAILASRAASGPFTTLASLLERVKLGSREVTALILSGGCDGLPPLHPSDYPFAHEAALEHLREGGDLAGLDRLPRPVAAGEVALYSGLVRVRNELRYLEMSLHAHPMALLRPEAIRYGCVPIEDVRGAPAGSAVRLAVLVAAMRRVPTRQGAMQFLTLEDETGLLEGAVLPPAYRFLGERVTTPGPFMVEGKVMRQQGAVHLDVTRLTPFQERQRPYGG